MKIAVVTGASSGMGREFVLQLPAWEQFDELWVIARRTERLEELKALLPFPVRPISLDLTAPHAGACAGNDCNPHVILPSAPARGRRAALR